jgi:hypothetical protein
MNPDKALWWPHPAPANRPLGRSRHKCGYSRSGSLGSELPRLHCFSERLSPRLHEEVAIAQRPFGPVNKNYEDTRTACASRRSKPAGATSRPLKGFLRPSER